MKGRWLIFIVLSATGALGHPEAWEVEAYTLPPKVERAWRKLVDEARPLRLESYKPVVMENVKRMTERFQLTPEQAAVLAATEVAVAEEATWYWEQSMRRVFRSPARLPGDVKEAVAAIEDIDAEWLSRFPAPYDHLSQRVEPWVAAVKEALSPAEFKKWQADQEAGVERRRARTEELLQAGLNRYKPAERYRAWLEEELGLIGEALRKDKTLRKAFEERVERWAEEYAEDSMTHCRHWLNACHPRGDTWPRAEKNGYYFFWIRREERLERHVGELKGLLPEEMRVAIKEAEAAQQKQARMLSDELRVVIVDEAVALTAEQREKVMDLAAAMPADPDLLSKASEYSYQKPWEDWKEEHLKALNEVLTDEQERQWLQQVKLFERSRLTGGEAADEALVRHPEAGPRSPAEVEYKISRMIAGKVMEKQRVEQLQSAVRVGDMVRVLNLDEARAAQLTLMAKGVAIQATQRYLKSYGDYVRRNLRTATPVNVDVLMGAMGNVSFSSRHSGVDLLEAWIAAHLTEEEAARLGRHWKERAELRAAVASQMALAPAERELALKPSQRQELMVELRKVMEIYGPDIESYFGSRYAAPWFLQSYQSPLPCGGVPEERVKEILTEDQMEIWEGRLMPRASNYWEYIERSHQQRLETEKESKKVSYKTDVPKAAVSRAEAGCPPEVWTCGGSGRMCLLEALGGFCASPLSA